MPMLALHPASHAAAGLLPRGFAAGRFPPTQGGTGTGRILLRPLSPYSEGEGALDFFLDGPRGRRVAKAPLVSEDVT